MVSQQRNAGAALGQSPTGRARDYREGTTNCKPRHRHSRAEELQHRQREVYQKLVKGLRGEECCFFFTLVNGQDLACELRKVAWHLLSTHLRQKYRQFQAFTVYEYRKRRGVHLHVVVKAAPGLTEEWVKHVLTLLDNGTEVGGWEDVYEADRLANYLTKDLGDSARMAGWPRHFHAVSFTRRWCPSWRSRKEWKARHVA